MRRTKQLKLGAFMRPVSIHIGAWRYLGAIPDASFNFPALKKFIQVAFSALLITNYIFSNFYNHR